jgi:hypothetical protein
VNQLSRLFAPDDTRDALRSLGGLLIGSGLLMVWLRKSGDQLGGGWGDWGLFVVLLLTFAFLYGVGMLGQLSIDRYRPWAGVYLVFGIIVAPFLLAQFVDAVNGNSGAALNLFWIFLVTAGLAVAAALLAEARYGLLLASLALIVSWSALWNKILSNGLAAHMGIYRGLLLVLAALLVVAGFAVALLDRPATVGTAPASRRFPISLRPPASDVITGATIAAVLAGSLSFTKIAALGNPFVSFPTAASSFFWELVLLVVSLLAIGYGAWAAVRGPTYVGAIGLSGFLLIAGIDLNDATPQGKIGGWPLALVIIGGVAFVASLLPRVKLPAVRFERGGGAPGPPPTAPQPSPPPSQPPPG